MATYRLWYGDDLGNRIAPIPDVQSFEYVSVLGGVGYATLSIPRRGQVYDDTVPDRRVHIYRQPTGGVSTLVFICLLRRFDITTTLEGRTSLSMDGGDLNELLSRRIAAEYSGEAETTMTNQADDMMKAIVTDHFIDNSDYSGTPSPTRSISTHGYSVAADLSSGPTQSKSFAWRNVLTVLQEIQATSKAQGKEIFFGWIPTSETAAQFRTWSAGRDRTITSGTNPILFSPESGNMSEPRLSYDHTAEANYIYGGGRGRETERVIQTSTNQENAEVSRLNRREAFAYSGGELAAAVLADARDELQRSRPKTTLTATLHDTPVTPYGGLRGWDLADKVTASYGGIQFEPIIRNIHVRVRSDGREIVKSRIEDV